MLLLLSLLMVGALLSMRVPWLLVLLTQLAGLLMLPGLQASGLVLPLPGLKLQFLELPIPFRQKCPHPVLQDLSFLRLTWTGLLDLSKAHMCLPSS